MSAPRRAFLVDTEMGRIVGGAQTFLLDLVPALARLGWDMEVLVEAPPLPPFAPTLEGAGVRVRGGLWRWPAIVEDAAEDLAKVVNSEQPDVFVVSVSSGVAWAALPLIDAGIPTVAIVHSDDEVFYGPLRHYREVVDHVIAVSAPIAGRLTAMGFDAATISTVLYGVPHGPQRAPSTDGPLSVAFIGRLSERDKNISTLVAAIEMSNPARVAWTVVGSGPDGQLFDRVSGRVKMLGHVPHGDVGRLLDHSDCLVLTSRREGTPLAILEAMARGVVPVVSDIPAHRQVVVPDATGVMFAVDDPGALVYALGSLADDRKRLQRLGASAWEKAKHQTPEVMAARYIDAFDAVGATVAELSPLSRPSITLMQSCQSPWPTFARRAKARMLRMRVGQ